MIHTTAIIGEGATIGRGTKIGPYCVIDAGVQIGEDCVFGPHVYVTGKTRIGNGNSLHAGAVIGDLPQDLRYKGAETGVVIGDHNVFREHVTVHKSNSVTEPTTIGSNNLFMANSHIGHNTQIGNHVIMANGALLGGHVTVQDRVFISGNCLVHQFVRIGTLALMQGGAGISKDLPPFTIATLTNTICGLNVVGMRRAGMTSEDRLELKQVYHLIFRGKGKFADRVQQARKDYRSEKAKVLLDFLAEGKKGFCADLSSKEARE